MEKYKVVDLFAGAGGLSLGFVQTKKYEIKVAFENNPNMQKTYRKNHPGVDVRGDVCAADYSEIKKEYGKSQSDDNIIKDHARKNKSIIYKQVEIYNPNVVILCLNNLLDGIFVNQEVGGYEVLGDQVPGANIKTIRVNGKEFYCYYNDKRIFINAYHPSWWYLNKEEYCDEIVRVINEWIEEREDE